MELPCLPASREQMVARRSFCPLRPAAGLPCCRPYVLRKVQRLPGAPLRLTMEPLSRAYAGQLELQMQQRKGYPSTTRTG